MFTPAVRFTIIALAVAYGCFQLANGDHAAYILFFAAAILAIGHFRSGPIRPAFVALQRGEIDVARKLVDSIKHPNLLSAQSLAYLHWIRGVRATVDPTDLEIAEREMQLAVNGNLRTSNDLCVATATLAEIVALSKQPNKATPAGRKQYLATQGEFIDAEVNLVEIDLLCEGTWVLAAEQEIYPDRLKGPYRVCVVRAESSEEAELYSAGFAAPLPTIRIPLRATDKDVLLPLQSLVNKAYENGRYGNDLDYTTIPVPPPKPEEQAWIADYLKSKTQTGSA